MKLTESQLRKIVRKALLSELQGWEPNFGRSRGGGGGGSDWWGYEGPDLGDDAWGEYGGDDGGGIMISRIDAQGQIVLVIGVTIGVVVAVDA